MLDDLEKRQLLAELQEKMFRRRERIELGRYVLVQRLGSGAMGVVYRAEDPQLRRDVAVKVLHPQRTDVVAGHERLRREARALGPVRHPNVIEVYDVGREGERVFIAMELVLGHSLEAWLAEEPRAWSEMLDVFVQAGRGLAAAHAAGLVHRDFKPSNVQVGANGVRVLDFGLAKAIALPSATAPSDDASPSSVAGPVTVDGAIVGTPRYMAPAQLLGADADAASDQYAFCVALWEALFGEPPFDPEAMLPSKESLAFAKLRPTSAVPLRVQRALRRGLAPEAKDRFPRIDALLDALVPPRSRRGGGIAIAGAFVGIGTIVGAIVMWPRAVEPPDAASPAASPETVAAAERALAGLERGRALEEADRVEEAIAVLEAAHTDAIAGADDRKRFAIAMELAGLELQQRHDAVRGRRWAADARATLERMEPDPKLRFGLGQVEIVLARAEGDGPAALTAARETVAHARAGWEPGNSAIIKSLQALGVTALEQQRFEEARAALTEAIAMGEASLPPDDPLPAYCLSILGGVDAMEASMKGDDPALLERAVASTRRAAEALERVLGRDHYDAINARLTLGITLAEASQNEEARKQLEYALAHLERVRGPDDPGVAVAAENLGTVLRELGELEAAEAMLHRAVIAMESMRGEDYGPLVTVLTDLALLQERRGAMAEAHATWERAVSVGEKVGPGVRAVALEGLAAAERREGRDARAAALYEDAAQAWTEMEGPSSANAQRVRGLAE